MLSHGEILGQTLALPPSDPEVKAVALQESLEGQTGPGTLGGSEFYEELRRRSVAYRAGQTQSRPAAEVMARLFQKQTDETAP